MAESLTRHEREAILTAPRAGQSVSAVARATGRAKTTVSRLARAAGLTLERSRIEKSTRVRQDSPTADRLALLNEGFSKAAALLPRLDTPLLLHQCSVMVQVLIDKHRLEEGR